MEEGLTRREIIQKIKNLPLGSFALYAARAGISRIGTRPNKTNPHIAENLYPMDSVERIMAVMPNKASQHG